MRINTNVSALNAQRNLGNTQQAINTSMQRLSSGFRINRAGDDAAGLGIANLMRASTRSMTQAARNAEQANSVLQIAEGATTSIQNMLERMKELATQAGSDSVDTDGRARINQEFNALREEITRTVDTTKFQGGHLLKTVEANPGSDAVDASATGLTTIAALAGVTSAGVAPTATADGDFRLYRDGTDVVLQQSDGDGGWNTRGTAVASGTISFDGITIELAADISSINEVGSAHAFSVTAYQPAVPPTEASGGDRSFLVSSSGAYNTDDLITLTALNLTVEALGIDDADLSEAASARDALFALDGAMEQVNEAIGNIGSSQNRIESALSNLRSTIQNMSAAESVIRDVDMAEEMTQFSKNQILSQAGTAMLAQANQSAQSILQLLRG